MSESPAIEVRNLVKKFSRNADRHRFYGVRDLLADVFLGRRERTLRADEFYAVNNVSFDVSRGECLGIIGRNGCGKTTTLRVICGLLRADYGTVRAQGSIQALIALGAGFDRDLNGLDNIKNSAAIAGFPPSRISALVDEIVDFAELGEFIESPVGTYSSGMYARLGFAVAVFLQPDILVIDEILGVGDYAFQNKCFLKINEVRNSGVTILLVSHSHARIVQMCERALWMDHGNLVMEGPSKEVVEKYIKSLEQEEVLKERKRQTKNLEEAVNRPRAKESPYGPIHDGAGHVAELHVRIGGEGGQDHIRTHDPLVIEYSFRLLHPVQNLNVSLNLLTTDGVLLTTISTLNGDLLKPIRDGRVHGRVRIRSFNVNPGSYVLVMPIHDGQPYLFRDVVGRFQVVSADRLAWGKLDFDYEYNVRGEP